MKKTKAIIGIIISIVLVIIGVVIICSAISCTKIDNKITAMTDVEKYKKDLEFILPDRTETVSIYEFDDPIYDDNGKLIEHQINYTAFLEYMYDHLYKENTYDHIVKSDDGFELVPGEKHSEFDVIDAATKIAAELERGATRFNLKNCCRYHEEYNANAQALYNEVKWIANADIKIVPRFVDMKNGRAPKDGVIPLGFARRDAGYQFPDVVENTPAVERNKFYNYIIDNIVEYIDTRYNTGIASQARIDKDLGILDQDTIVKYETYGFSVPDNTYESVQEQFNELVTNKRGGFINFDVYGADGAFNLINGQDQDIIFVSIKDQDLRWYNLQWDEDKQDITTKLVYETPVVTGRYDKHDTPVGVYYVSEKKTNKYLVGEGYRSFVNYWMRLTDKGVGLHDAAWRGSFGEEIYKTNGSHGCINLPKTAAAELYSKIGVGQCVVVTDSGFQNKNPRE